MDAAIDEFKAKGYTGATTAAIAQRAGVTEALLFKHFGSKAQLFQDVIFKPLDRHFSEFQEAYRAEAGDVSDRRVGSRKYIDELQKFVSGHSGMMMSLVVAQAYGLPGVEGVAQMRGLHHYFTRMAKMAESNLEKPPLIDPGLVARISFATIIACALFKDWLFPPDIGFDETQIRAAVTDFLMEGLNANSA